ncbi:MAG TPA: ATPase domain-containing protein [Polyangiaceae bacterium]|nr:ATPase domain-containing protein [Polyangiaceae bacterium]
MNCQERVSTGNTEADEILGGGFPSNSINIVMGQPGTGKSIFAEQLVFSNASDDRPILYLTTLSEPLAKMVGYLQRFAFFDEDKVGKSVLFEDVGPQLVEGGMRALLVYLQKAIEASSPKMIVIDSFRALHDLAPSPLELRHVLFELTGLLTAFRTTAFLVGEYTDGDAQRLPEFAVADGIVQFMRNPMSTRDERFLRVLKLRGSAYLEGLHAFRIGAGGLEIFPRLVSPEIPETYTIVEERVSSGVEGLDPLLGGGFWRGSTTLLAGPTGAGKTTAGLQFVLEGVRRGEACLYANFQENPMQLDRSLRGLGADVEDVKSRGLHLMYASPVELQVDRIIVSLFRQIQRAEIRRVVIDAVGELVSSASDPQRLHDYLYALVQHFTVRGVTSMLMFEITGGGPDSWFEANSASGRFSYMSDNIIILSTARRRLSVVKARATLHDLGSHELEITGQGLRVKDAVGAVVRPGPRRPLPTTSAGE